MDMEEVANSVAAMPTEESDNLQRFTIHNVYFLIASIRHIEKLLLFIRRKRDIESGAFRARSLPFNVVLLHERAVQPKNLDTIIHPVAHIHQAIVRNPDAVHQV